MCIYIAVIYNEQVRSFCADMKIHLKYIMKNSNKWNAYSTSTLYWKNKLYKKYTFMSKEMNWHVFVYFYIMQINVSRYIWQEG